MANQGKGFGRTVDASETRRYSSWGRTRTPKNILSKHRKGTDGTSGITVNQGTTTDAYFTENQRFLFVEISDRTGGCTLTINGRMHAGSGTVRALTTPDMPTMNAVGLYKIDISGIDEVSFTATGGTSVVIFAACSSF